MTIRTIQPIPVDKPTETIQWGAYQLPCGLFYQPSEKKSFISPAALFEPGAALQDNPWQSLMPPSSTPKPKTLVLTVDIYRWQHSRDQWLALIHWLEQRGFVIYLCTQDEDDQIQLLPANDHLNGDTTYSLLERLTSFNKAEDYETLASQYNLPRAHVEVLDRTNLPDFLNCVAQPTRYMTDSELFDVSAFMAIRPGCVASSGTPFNRDIVIKNPGAITDLIKKNNPVKNKIQEPDQTSVVEFIAQKPNSRKIHKYLRRHPSKTDEFLAATYSYFIDEMNQRPFSIIQGLPLEQIKKIVVFFAENLDYVTHTPLIVLILKYAPDYANLLAEKKWDPFKTYRMHHIDALIYSPETNELLLDICRRQYKSQREQKKPITMLHEQGLERTNMLDKVINMRVKSKHLYLKSNLEADLTACNNKATALLNKVSESITDKIPLLKFLEFPHSADKELLIRCANIIDQEIIDQREELISELLFQKKITIQNSPFLALSIKNNPQKAKQLLIEHADKIQTVFDLSACCAALTNINDIKELIQWHAHKTNAADLLRFVSKENPRLFFWIIKNYGMPFKTAKSMHDFVRYHCPERLEWSLNYFDFQEGEITEPRRLQAYSDVWLKRSALQYAMTEKVIKLPLADITYLYLDDDQSFKFLMTAVQQGEMPSLVVVEIACCYFAYSSQELITFFNALQAHCPHVKRILLPTDLRENSFNFSYQISYHKTSVELREEQEKQALVELAEEEKKQALIKPPKEQKKQALNKPQGALPRTLYIANNGLNTTINNNNGNIASFKMCSVGELLNNYGQTPHRLRTGIIELSADFKSQRYCTPVLTPILTPKILSDEEINIFKNVEDTTLCYYKIPIVLTAGKTIRLLSADCEEGLLGIQVTTKIPLKFSRGNDDFFYCLSPGDAQLTYVIKVDSVEILQKKFAALSNNDPVIAIINDYKNSPKYKPMDSGKETPPIPQGNRLVWLETLYENRSGNCAYRCYAVSYAINKKNSLSDRVRMADIDNNHMRLEIYMPQNKRWYQVDLGGGKAELIYDNENSSLYKPQAIETPGLTKNTNNNPSSNIKIQEKKSETSNLKLLENKKNTASEKSDPIKNHNNNNVSSPSHENRQEDLHKKAARQDLLRALIYQQSKPEPISSKQGIRDLVLQQQNLTCLVVSKDLDTQANAIIEQARLNNIPLFYLDKPKQYGSDKPKIILDDQAEPIVSQHDILDLFLEKIKNLSAAIILVNWKAFSPQERIALNTLIDAYQKSVYGKPCPLWLKVISLYPTLPKDMSVRTRHKHYVSTLAPEKNVNESNNEVKTYLIDAQGYPNWQAYLFGPIVLIDNQLVWKKGPLTERLLQENRINKNNVKTVIEIINLPTEAIKAFTHWIDEAKAAAAFCYHGYDVAFPESVMIDVKSEPFSFKQFPPVNVCENVTAENIFPDCRLINATLFDYLLKTKSCVNGQYRPLKGWLSSAKNQTLSLFVTSELLTNQWYCLFATAQRKQVTLALYLAPGVVLPNDLEKIPLAMPILDAPFPMKNRLFVCNQSQPKIAALRQEKKMLCLAVDDYAYKDLVGGIDYKYTPGIGFHDFKEETSDLMIALEKGTDILLHGQFSTGLLEALAPLLLKSWPGQLTLVIEDKQLNEASLSKPYPDLNWLPVEAYQLSLQSEPIASPIVVTEPLIPVGSDHIDLTDSEQKAADFIQNRFQVMLDLLPKHRMLQLIGSTGVGKSYLMNEFENKYRDDITVYHELNQIEAYASDRSTKAKVLFIDESNMEDVHLTVFDPLKKREDEEAGEVITLLYQGKFLFLTANHWVVFARNAHDFGGGRHQQNLYADGTIPEFRLEDMPPTFIFERMLKPILNRQLPQQALSPLEIKALAISFLTRYYKDNQTGIMAGVRELQERVLAFCLHQDPEQSSFVEDQPLLPNRSFVPTPSTTEIRRSLHDFTMIRKMLHSYHATAGMGLNCFIIEGKPGNGKTELIRHHFEQMGCQEAHLGDVNDENGYFYYKVDASLPLKKKEKYFIDACEKGYKIWLDEINSCLDDGLEKITNNVLSGKHPVTGQYGTLHPRFGLIVSVNSMSLKGRSLLGPAFRARALEKKMPEPSLDDLRTIIEYRFRDTSLESTDVETMAQDLYACFFEKGARLTLRFIIPQLIKIAELYPFNPDNVSLEKFIRLLKCNFLESNVLLNESVKIALIRKADLNFLTVLMENPCWPQWLDRCVIDEVMQMRDESKALLLKFLLTEPSSKEITLSIIRVHYPTRFAEFELYGKSVAELRERYRSNVNTKKVELPLEVAQALIFDKILNYFISKYNREAKGLEPKPGQKPKDAWQRYHERLIHYTKFHRAMIEALIQQPANTALDAELQKLHADNPIPKGKKLAGFNASTDNYGALIRLLIAAPVPVLLLRFKEMVDRVEVLFNEPNSPHPVKALADLSKAFRLFQEEHLNKQWQFNDESNNIINNNHHSQYTLVPLFLDGCNVKNASVRIHEEGKKSQTIPSRR